MYGTDGKFIRQTGSVRAPLHVLEDVALVVSCGDLEGQRGVVTLQHCRVVVQYGQFTSRVTQEGVCTSRMVDIMHSSSDQGRHLIYGVQTLLRNRHTREHHEVCHCGHRIAESKLPKYC